MSLYTILQELRALKRTYGGVDAERISAAIENLTALGSGESSYSGSGPDYSYDYDAHRRYGPGRYGRSSYQEHGLMGPPSYNNDRTQDGCPECQPGRPCYGHGH